MNILVRLAFDGTDFCGFQVQKNGASVAEAIQNAIEAVLGSRPDIKGCSRTDAGVHARDFALNFHADTAIPMAKLPLALNQNLPESIRALSAQAVPEAFHARYAAHAKTYCYRIRNTAIDLPFDARYTVRVPQALDVEAMNAAAAYCVGTHDFLAFCAAGSAAAAHGDTVRTVTACRAMRAGDIVTITVTADGYLYNMVRILAGTLVQAGLGRLAPEEVLAILKSRDRRRAGPTMPAKGLTLEHVAYGADALGQAEDERGKTV
ncbi:MAG: tRNA pseudouridine(38-40) synthase TruA [Faecalibacterium sp.]|jgi:tRNA pseudouridine38-40 synthase|nr:tRNA pseudouridine(38-40) synthase TruA [Faecalibacterium sp.]